LSNAKTFEDLKGWQKAHAFTLAVYRVSAAFPKSEKFGLTSQLRRSASSVPTNIVEGFNCLGMGEKVRFYNIAQASLEEARYHSLFARDLGYHSDYDTHAAMAEEVRRMLHGLIRSVKTNYVKEGRAFYGTTPPPPPPVTDLTDDQLPVGFELTVDYEPISS